MSQIRVECYSGYRADQRPERFTLRGRQFEIEQVEDQWYSPGAVYFRVLAQDGNYYLLRHDEGQDFWTVDGFRAGGRK
ncbi:MAG TPA: hypothetical protein VEH50_00020 [Methylomirabilota bacterium]|jgi:hypothetical protein|nr:hypothetical protein [Methylomirabilota bacterium]